MRIGVAVANLPISSSVCMIFFILAYNSWLALQAAHITIGKRATVLRAMKQTETPGLFSHSFPAMQIDLN